RWLTRRDQDAEDVVQEAYLRAFQFFGSFHGGGGRAWLLAVLRDTCYSWVQRQKSQVPVAAFGDEVHAVTDAFDPLLSLLRVEDQQLVCHALGRLPAEFREVIVLRELEGLSYKEIAQIVAIPMGTVMSRLARARERLQQLLAPRMK